MEDKFAGLLKRLEAVTTKLETVPAGGAGAAPPAVGGAPPAVEDEAVPPMVVAFDDFLNGTVAAYVAAAGAINMPETAKQAGLLKQAFEAQRAMLLKVPKAKKPSPAEFQELAKATSELLGQVQGCATTDRRADDYNHRQAVAEAVPAIGWVMVEKTPVPHITDMWDCGAFNQTKIITTYKGKDEAHITFAKSLKAVFTDLAAYVKEFHRVGLEWNPKGVAGGAVTSGLKKVTKGEDWDPSKYGGGKKKPVYGSAVSGGGAAKAAAPVKEPKLVLNGTKWEVEHQVKQSGLTIESDVKQKVYVYQCTDSVLTVTGKTNAITLDGCKKMALVFDSVVAGVELINCTSCKVQVKNLAMTFSVDKCSGTQLILNKESLAAEIISAKSSELNIIVPGANEGDEFKEFAIPEQFVSKWDGSKWVTESMAHSG